MLTVALEAGLNWPFRDETVNFDRFDEMLEFLARHFVDLVDERLRLGLYRSYVDVEDNLSFVRGRIAFTEDLRHNYALRHRTWCRYSELTWDVPESQVLRQVARLLAGWGFGSTVRLKLARLDAALDEVTCGRMVAPCTCMAKIWLG